MKRSVQGKLASATHSQTESYLKPLFRKLRKKVDFGDNLGSCKDIVCMVDLDFSFVMVIISLFRVYQLTSKSQSQTSLNSCWRENMSRYDIICIIVFLTML